MPRIEYIQFSGTRRILGCHRGCGFAVRRQLTLGAFHAQAFGRASVWRYLALLLVGLALANSAPAAGAATLSWSGANPIDAASASIGGLTGVACVSSTECVSVDEHGDEVTFNPTTGAITAGPKDVDGGDQASSVACAPSSVQCTVVGYGGYVGTFNATTGAQIAGPTQIVGYTSLAAVACPSTTQCTAVDGNLDTVTFDPTTETLDVNVQVDTHDLISIACPTTAQCTATDETDDEVTFDPLATGGSPTPVQLSTNPYLFDVTYVTCLSTSECVAVDDIGDETTFDPITSTITTGPTEVATDNSVNPLNSVTCPSSSQCTAVGYGEEVTFDPGNAALVSAPSLIDSTTYRLTDVACPSITQCIAIDDHGNEFVTTSSLMVTVVGSGTVTGTGTGTGTGLSCTAICWDTYDSGATVTLNASSPAGSQFGGWSGGGCSGTGTCTVSLSSNQSVSATFLIAPYTRTPVTSTPPVKPNASVTSITTNAGTVRELLKCSSSPSGACELSIRLSVVETVRGGKVIAIAAASKKPTTKKRKLTVGSAAETVPSGKTLTVTLKLNRAGQQLLAARHRLKVAVATTFDGIVVANRTVTFTTPTGRG